MRLVSTSTGFSEEGLRGGREWVTLVYVSEMERGAVREVFGWEIEDGRAYLDHYSGWR